MEIWRREIQTNLLKYGSLKKTIQEKGVPTIIDFAISKFLDLMAKRFYKQNSTKYGLFEALFRRDIDRWSRYAHVTNEIRKTKGKELLVLEVGSGGQGISTFLSQLRRDYDFFLLDVQKDVFKGLRKVHCVIGDGCRLPFRNKAFDIVVSVDTVEHIPKRIRQDFYTELKRVCKKRIILACPIQSSDCIYQGQKYDITFQHLYEKNYGVKEPNTAQHIAAGHPTLEEIRKELPNSTIYGYKNCDTWLRYMLFSMKPLTRLFTGIIYYLFWKRNDDKTPYWGGIITWTKTKPKI